MLSVVPPPAIPVKLFPVIIIFPSREIIIYIILIYLKAGNSCYYSVQTPLYSRFLPKNLKIKIYKTIILPVVLYGCETWSLTLREEYRLRVFENRILRRVFGPKRDENGEWTIPRNERLFSLYHSPNIVSVIKSRMPN